MIVFSICSKNFLGYASSLHASLRQQYRDIRFYTALCDDVAGFDCASLDFEIITVDKLGIPKFEEMRSRYNITELNTSIKPFVFLYLFDQHPGEVVVYLDPDILVTGPFVELQACFEQGASCVLTPHIVEPAEFAEFDDQKFLIHGIYNLGFCALRDTEEVRRVVSWWGRRLERHCVIDRSNGIFVDQKWADLLPAFIQKTVVLRHPGYNVAYWNLSQRRVRRTPSGWTVNDQPLRFFHFSGNEIENPSVFSRHSRLFRVENIGDLRLLLDYYRSSVLDHGHSYYSGLPYGFAWNDISGQNEHTPMSLALQRRRGAGTTPHLPLLRLRSREEFDEARSQTTAVIRRRLEIECAAIPKGQETFTLAGFCVCCQRETRFQVGSLHSFRRRQDGRPLLNWREHLDCLSCGLINRVRASLHILEQIRRPDRHARIYITERKTRTYDWLAQRYPNLQGSEYRDDALGSGDVVGGVGNGDLPELSFPDDSFEYILALDVLEHLPDYLKALHELFRCLKPGGTLLVTVPFNWESEGHVIRAVRHEDGRIEHLMEPEYHGNPVGMEGGSLCFRYFGWQILRDLQAAGFIDAEVLNYWSAHLRYFGDPQFVIVARKPGSLGLS